MNQSTTRAHRSGATKLLCAVVLALMLASIVYVAILAVRYYGQIGV